MDVKETKMKTEDIKSMAAAWAQVQEASKKKLDPVGQADADIDNDGDVDNSDKYLHNRRKAISKNMKKDEVEMNPKKKEDKADAAQAVESVAPIYAKILEKRDMHTKGATPPEKMTDKFTAQDKKMADDHGGIDGNESGIDGAKAAEGTAKAIAASGKTSSNHNRAADNKAGDKNIINKVTQSQ